MSEESTDKFCIKCVYLLGNRSYADNHSNWKCGAPENIIGKKLNLLTGEEITIYRVYLCSDNRIKEDALPRCGVEGKWYKEYIQPRLREDDVIVIKGDEKKIFRKKLTESDLSNL